MQNTIAFFFLIFTSLSKRNNEIRPIKNKTKVMIKINNNNNNFNMSIGQPCQTV